MSDEDPVVIPAHQVQVVAFENGEDEFGPRIEIRAQAVPMGASGDKVLWAQLQAVVMDLDLAEAVANDMLDEVRRLKTGLAIVTDQGQVAALTGAK